MVGVAAPKIIVLALGAAALGGPDALRALLTLAGQSPVVDIGICLLVIGMFTAHVLGVVLLARFVRKPRGGGARRPRAPAADCFARMTLTVSVGVAFSVTACLVAVSGGGLMSSVRPVFEFAGTSPIVLAAVFLLLCFTPLLRATETRWTACLAALPFVGTCLLAAPSVARAGSLNTLTGVAAFTVVGTMLLARFSSRVGSGAGTAITDTARFARLTAQVTSLAVVVCFTLAYFLIAGVPGGESEGGKHAA